MEADFLTGCHLFTNSAMRRVSFVAYLHRIKYELLYSGMLFVNMKGRKYLWHNVVVIVIVIIIIIVIIVVVVVIIIIIVIIITITIRVRHFRGMQL